MLNGLDKILSMLVTIAIYGTYEENDSQVSSVTGYCYVLCR